MSADPAQAGLPSREDLFTALNYSFGVMTRAKLRGDHASVAMALATSTTISRRLLRSEYAEGTPAPLTPRRKTIMQILDAVDAAAEDIARRDKAGYAELARLMPQMLAVFREIEAESAR